MTRTTTVLGAVLGERLGKLVTDLRPLGGGDINDAFAVTLADGTEMFLKTRLDAPKEMFPAEARGLAWLEEAKAIRIPHVLLVSRPEDPPFLLLELIRSGRRVPDFDERLGRALARLHRFGAPTFGLDRDNFIGNLPQSNRARASFADFYREQRLEPQVARARDAGHFGVRELRRFDALFSRLDELVGPPEPPARLHGDLWGGNLHVDERGEPCLIDPAVYGGHREIDWGMMQLFGGFGPRVLAAYRESYPLAPGFEERVALFQLYPLLVHVNLFGSGYVGQVMSALSAYV